MIVLASTNFQKMSVDLVFLVLVGLMAPSYALILVGLGLSFREQRRRVPRRDEPSGIEQFPAALTLRRDVVYGSDEGLVSFVDGWLVFRGRNCEFSVREQDIHLNLAIDGPLVFDYEGSTGSHRATLRPLAKGLREAWIAWRFRHERPGGEPLYPPATPIRGIETLVVRLGVVGAIGEMVAGVLSLKALPIACAFHFAFAAGFIVFIARRRDALRRIAENRPAHRRGESPSNLPGNAEGLSILPDGQALGGEHETITSREAEARTS